MVGRPGGAAVGDPFGTAALRAAVLAGWAASAARFREDANAEEDLVRGGYRDRLVVELAQNAADAARRAGVPGRLRLELVDDAGLPTLLASNVGAPLDADGVVALSTLRASAKRGDADVGRFGVGFAAVLAVSDAPAVRSANGGVRWASASTVTAVAALPAAAAELAARGGHVPTLRLPFPDATRPVAGWDTTVALPLRDEAALVGAREMLAGVDDGLLVALPALAEVSVADRLPGAAVPAATVADVGSRWRTVTATGEVEPALLADRPTEERVRTRWSVTWAVPRSRGTWARVVHAPTPTDEPLGLPALLVATLPLEPSRRHVARGPLTDVVLREAGTLYAGLLAELAADGLPVLALVPVGLAAGELDADVRRAALAALADAAVVPGVGGGLLRPRDAVSVEGLDEDAALAVLAEAAPGLVASGRENRGGLAALGVRTITLAEAVDALAGLRRAPDWWHGAYEALQHLDREALGALPVPLADGRTVRGARGLLVGGADLPTGVEVLGLRVVDPVAAHPLLARLGAVPADAAAVLADPGVREAVERSIDEPDGDAVADAVLGLVRAASLRPGDLSWLSRLALPDDTGERAEAGELMLPDALLRPLVDDDAFGVVDPDLVERWGRDPLVACGVVDGFGLVTDDDVLLDPDTCHHDLADEDLWVDELAGSGDRDAPPPVLARLVAVRDLDLVRPDRWTEALALLARPPWREAVVGRPRLLGGAVTSAPSYTAWWLGREPVLGGHRPTVTCTGEDPLLAVLYDIWTGGPDDQLLASLGVRTTLEALLAEPSGASELLDRLADPGRAPTRTQLVALYTAVAEHAAADGRRSARAGEFLRVPEGSSTRLVAADDVVVLDLPCALPLLTESAVVTVPLDLSEPLAEALDVRLATEVVAGRVSSGGVEVATAPAVLALLASAPRTWVEHDELVVDGREVAWWVEPRGTVHAATLDGLARALAWSAGEWGARQVVAAALADPSAVDELRHESELDGAAAARAASSRSRRLTQ